MSRVHARVCVCTCVFTRKEKKGQEKPQDSTSPPTAAGHLEAPWATANGLALLPGVPGKVPGGRGSLGRKRPRATLRYCPLSLPAGWVRLASGVRALSCGWTKVPA